MTSRIVDLPEWMPDKKADISSTEGQKDASSEFTSEDWKVDDVTPAEVLEQLEDMVSNGQVSAENARQVIGLWKKYKNLNDGVSTTASTVDVDDIEDIESPYENDEIESVESDSDEDRDEIDMV